jgi:Putative adhesin
MTRWTVAAPTALDFDDVTELNVRLIGGTVAVLASDGEQSSAPDAASSASRASLAVTELSGRPIQVNHENGVLTVSYESLTWDGLLSLLKPRKDSATVTITVPADCPIQLGVLSASAVVAGLHAGAAVRGMSGDITLDRVTGDVSAETMSGEVAGCDLDGQIRFKSMSGGLTLAGGAVDALMVDTLSGQVTADVALSTAGSVRVNTMSGEVTLRLPADSDANVHLHSTSGPVRTEFETLRTVKAPASHTVSGNVGAGNGSGHVSVTTMSGAVTLLRGVAVNARKDDPPSAPGKGMESKTL